MGNTKRLVALMLTAAMSFSACGEGLSALAETINLPKNLLTIDDKAFYQNSSIDEVVVPYGTESIGSLAFAYSGISSIYIPSTVETIADDAFEGDENLTISSLEEAYAYEYATENGINWSSSETEQDEEISNITEELKNNPDFHMNLDDEELISTDGITDSEELAEINEYNSLTLECVEATNNYNSAIDQLQDTVTDSYNDISSVTYSSKNNSFSFDGQTVMSFGGSIPSIGGNVSLVSYNASDDGTALSLKLSSGGKTFYANIINGSLSFSNSSSLTSRGSGTSSGEIQSRGVANNLKSLIDWEQLQWDSIQSAFEAIGTALDEAESKAYDALKPFKSRYDNWKGFNPKNKYLAQKISKNKVNYFTCLAKYKLIKASKCLYKSALKGLSAINYEENFQRAEEMYAITFHGHPTDEEKTGENSQLAKQVGRECYIACGSYVVQTGLSLLAGYDLLVGLCGAVTAVIAPPPQVKAAAAGLTKAAIVDMIKEFVAEEIVAQVGIHFYDKVIEADPQLHTDDDYITFGHYPQTAEGTDSTPIEWLVLEKSGSNALVISRYALDAQLYYTEWTEVTWSSCTLRTWLNSTFLNKAFTSTERAAILTTTVDNSQSQNYDWAQLDGWEDYTYKSDANTSDKIFLLSCAEANKYLGVTIDNLENMTSRAEPTAYAVAQGASQSDNYYTSDGKGASWWWLRTSGFRGFAADGDLAACVADDGSLSCSVLDTGRGVRPAMWVNLSAIQ